MTRQPYIYTLPEAFIEDKSVPMRWKLYALINGYWISNLTAYASNRYFAEKLGCTERHVQSCLEDLEDKGVLRRVETPKGRVIMPGGTNPAFVGERTESSAKDEPSVHPNSDSNSDSITSETSSQEVRPVFIGENDEPRSKKPAKYPNARTVFTWFPNPQLSWRENTTECKYAEFLFLRGEGKVRSALAYVAANQDVEYFYQVTKPSDLEKKWADIVAYSKKN